MDRPQGPIVSRRRVITGGLGAALLVGAYLAWGRAGAFPPETTPQGAYLRIVLSISQGDPRDCFAYLEDQAQHAAYSIRDYRKQAFDRVGASYPEPERGRLLEAYREQAAAPDGADIWAVMAQKRGWIVRLRKDLSGVVKVEESGERATIETARGTRYGFRKRKNGIWGLSIFTAELMAEAERAARDAEVVEKAAADYERGK
ncbi:MAG: hypothetical protein ABI193_11490 [Minicystis sp.]